MNKLNLKLYHDIQRRNIDAKLLDYVTVKNKLNQDVRVFNYMSGEVGKLFDKIYKNYEEAGLTKKEAMDEVISKSNLYKVDVEKYLKGEVPLPSHHLFAILKTAEINLDGSLKKQLHTSEAYGNSLVINRHLYPKFYVNINTDDYNDFQVHYKTKNDRMSSKKLVQLLMIMFRWYFKNKNPYTRQMIYDRVQQLYYTGELELIKKTK